MYMYVCTYVCVHIYIYIYIHIMRRSASFTEVQLAWTGTGYSFTNDKPAAGLLCSSLTFMCLVLCYLCAWYIYIYICIYIYIYMYCILMFSLYLDRHRVFFHE